MKGIAQWGLYSRLYLLFFQYENYCIGMNSPMKDIMHLDEGSHSTNTYPTQNLTHLNEVLDSQNSYSEAMELHSGFYKFTIHDMF